LGRHRRRVSELSLGLKFTALPPAASLSVDGNGHFLGHSNVAAPATDAGGTLNRYFLENEAGPFLVDSDADWAADHDWGAVLDMAPGYYYVKDGGDGVDFDGESAKSATYCREP